MTCDLCSGAPDVIHTGVNHFSGCVVMAKEVDFKSGVCFDGDVTFCGDSPKLGDLTNVEFGAGPDELDIVAYVGGQWINVPANNFAASNHTHLLAAQYQTATNQTFDSTSGDVAFNIEDLNTNSLKIVPEPFGDKNFFTLPEPGVYRLTLDGFGATDVINSGATSQWEIQGIRSGDTSFRTLAKTREEFARGGNEDGVTCVTLFDTVSGQAEVKVVGGALSAVDVELKQSARFVIEMLDPKLGF